MRNQAHIDPDWNNFSYGDCLDQRRGAALGNVNLGDMLLFWGLLHTNEGHNWDGFTGQRGWYLFGQMHISKIIQTRSDYEKLSQDEKQRTTQNAHFRVGEILRNNDIIFLGDHKRSCLFNRAVDLQVENEQGGLIYNAFTAADGRRLSLMGSPRWSSSLRSCRRVIDVAEPTHNHRAEILRSAICSDNPNVDILSD